MGGNDFILSRAMEKELKAILSGIDVCIKMGVKEKEWCKVHYFKSFICWCCSRNATEEENDS